MASFLQGVYCKTTRLSIKIIFKFVKWKHTCKRGGDGVSVSPLAQRESGREREREGGERERE